MLWSLFAAYALARGPAPRITAWVATAIVAFIAAKMFRPTTFRSAIGVGCAWAFMHAVLDAIFVIPAASILAFTTYNAWINYGIVFFAVVAAFAYQHFVPHHEEIAVA